MSLELREGLEVAERFRLERELGRGGMGSVWLARHMGLDILCAIKFIDQQGRESAELRGRFEREAKSAAQLKSPHVVQILDYGVWEEAPYIAMEYLEGEDLSTRLDTALVLSAAETCRILAQVAKALMKAHAAGIVHRDLKPENIFLVRDGDEVVAKVLDFGIAKSSGMVMDDSRTKTGSLLGTPFYMSPEQARGVKAIDHRSDLWSLAVIAYQCVTGQLPFESEGLGDLLAKIMYEAIPVPSEVNASVPPAFDAWWKRGSARRAEDRFQSARELSNELAIALGVTEPGVLGTGTVDRSSWSEGRAVAAESDSALSLGGTLRINLDGPNRTGSELLTLAGDTGNPLVTTVTGFEAPSPRKRGLVIAFGGALAAAVLGIFAFVGFGEDTPAKAPLAAPSLGVRREPALTLNPTPSSPNKLVNPTPTTDTSRSKLIPPVPEEKLKAPLNKPLLPKPTPPVAAPARKTKVPSGKPSAKKPVDFGI